MYIVNIQLHGKIDLYQPEPGLDNDTGGQIIYVLQACKELARNNHRVTILTRLLDENNQYCAKEQKRNGVHLIRLPLHSNKYLAKEKLWPFIEDFADSCLNYLIDNGEYPDVIIGNYADAGAVGLILCRVLNIPLIFIPHSLGRVKRQCLIDNGQQSIDDLDKIYNFAQRIFYEEQLFKFASAILISSEHEKKTQCSIYTNFCSDRVKINPPGISTQSITDCYPIEFLKKPILLIGRLSKTKNLVLPIDIIYSCEWLRTHAEIIIATTQKDRTDNESKEIYDRIIERSKLYKNFMRLLELASQEDIFRLFRSVEKARGIYFNPSLVEPFGLTALEAASFGLPVVLTDNGGTVNIVENTNIGYCVNVCDPDDIIFKIRSLLNDNNFLTWTSFSNNGLNRIRENYSWNRWVESFQCTAENIKSSGLVHTIGGPE